MAKSKEEFVFPSTPSEARELKEEMQKVVNLMIELDVIKSDIASITEDANEEYGIPKVLFGKYTKAMYDREKFLQMKELMDSIADNIL